jgi:signal peptidase I
MDVPYFQQIPGNGVDILFGNVKNPVLRETLDWTAHILIALILGFLIVNFVLQRTIVQEYSMEPTLFENDNLWVEKLSPRFGWLKHGDIVTIYAARYLEPGKKFLIKRIIAKGNETIEIKDGKVYVNRKKLDENYIGGIETMPVNSEFTKVKVKPGYVYVMGDNRGNSLDSRTIGPVSVKDITGKAFMRFFPLNRMRFL